MDRSELTQRVHCVLGTFVALFCQYSPPVDYSGWVVSDELVRIASHGGR